MGSEEDEAVDRLMCDGLKFSTDGESSVPLMVSYCTLWSLQRSYH